MATNRSGARAGVGEDPKYKKIAAELRDLIAEAQPATRLPTEADLAIVYETTRVTVRKAYDLLIDEALVEKRGPRQGPAGYFVRRVTTTDWTLTAAGRFVDHWADKTSALAGTPEPPIEVVTVSVPKATRRVAGTPLSELFSDAGDRFACRTSLRYLSAGPVEITEVYAPYDLVKDSAFMADDPASVTDLLAAYGRTAAGFADHTTARPPQQHEADRLELPPATWVLDVLRSVYGYGGECVLVQHSVFNALGTSLRHSGQA